MKRTENYITPLPPKEQKALYQWYTVSAYLIIGLCSTLVIINIYQYMNVKKIQRTHKALHTSLQQMQHEIPKYELLKQENETLQKRIAKIELIKNKQTFNPLSSLEDLAQYIPSNVCLTEFNCSKKNNLSFQGYAQTAESAVSFLSELKKLPHMTHLQLTSLSPIQFQKNDKTWYQFHVNNK